MFAYSRNFFKAEPCDKRTFDKILLEPFVAERCAKLKQVVESIPADASEEELKKYEELKKELKAGNKEKHMKPLPEFAFHATFKDNYRCNENAIASGLCSIDLDHLDDPRTFFSMLHDKLVERHLALAFISPSSQGLKLVLPLPEGANTMEEAQDMIVRELGIESYFDAGTTDMARLAFAVPADYVLYRNDDELFMEREVPASFESKTTEPDNELVIEHESEEKADEHFVDGIAMTQMLEYLSNKYCGMAEPDLHHRNNTLYKSARVMRVACDNDVEMLYKVMPRWGQTLSEWNNTLRSACKHSITIADRKEFDDMMLRLKREKALNDGTNIWLLPEPPKHLPPVFREYARITPPELRPAMLLSLLPTLGFYGSMSKANFADPDEHEDWRAPNFNVVVIAPTASGKNTITQVYKDLTRKQSEEEAPLLQQLNRYNQNKTKEQPPVRPILLMPEKLSMTSLSVQLENARGHHLLQFTPEIDTLKSSNGSGAWNDLSTVFRKAFDNDSIGQIYMSGDSHCCNVPVYLNQLIEAQPERTKVFFNRDNVLNGLVSRIIFCELPDNTGCRKQKVKKMSEFEQANVERIIESLKKIGIEIAPAQYDDEGNEITPAEIGRRELKISRCRKALKAWGISHQDHFLQNLDNPSEDHFFRRAQVIGYHAAMVAYMCNGCKESREVIDFALWVAEYVLQSQMLHFGVIFNSIHQKRTESRTDDIIQMKSVSKLDVFGLLPEEFTTQDIRDIYKANGKSLKNPSNKIAGWKSAEMISEVVTDSAKKKWRKKV